MTPEAMAALHELAFAGQGRAWSATEFLDLLSERHGFSVHVADGFAIGRVVAGEAELLTIATHPDQRRQGIARHIMARFEDAAATRGATQSFLEVAQDNAAARALYEACGYAQVARRAGYYRRPDGRVVDALILSKPLDGN